MVSLHAVPSPVSHHPLGCMVNKENQKATSRQKQRESHDELTSKLAILMRELFEKYASFYLPVPERSHFGRIGQCLKLHAWMHHARMHHAQYTHESIDDDAKHCFTGFFSPAIPDQGDIRQTPVSDGMFCNLGDVLAPWRFSI
jgi:hypothetical protein